MTTRPVLVSQRVDTIAVYSERRDALDQRWAAFLHACSLLPIPVPNATERLADYLALPGLAGVVLTGGNNLAALGGNTPERDRIEGQLLTNALAEGLPLIGVCRGMQFIQHSLGVTLQPVEGHVCERQVIQIGDRLQEANSYHRFAALDSSPDLAPWAWADDKVIKAVRHRHAPILGIMWHPERLSPFAERDIQLFTQHFKPR